MKRFLLSLAVVAMCVMVASAQLLERNPILQASTAGAAKAPKLKTLGQNQLYMGPYASDALSTDGLGIPTAADQATKLGVLLPAEMIEKFDGGVVRSIRIGLCAPITHGKVFIYPVTSVSPLTLGNALVEQTITQTTLAGWNTIDLSNAVTLNTQGLQGLLLGYQYAQKNTVSGGYYTSDCYPVSAVHEGVFCTTYLSSNAATSGAWQDAGLADFGNLSVQAIVESDDFPNYDLGLIQLTVPEYAKQSSGIEYSLSMTNQGLRTLEQYTIDILLDGVVLTTIDSPLALTQVVSQYHGVCALDGVNSGQHTLAAQVKTVGGTMVTNGPTVSATFKSYQRDYPRKKHLVEQFTSQYCTYCPGGEANLEALEQLRGGDMAWVAVHGNMSSGNDIFTITKGTQLMSYLGVSGFPSAAFNRKDVLGTGSVATGVNFNGTPQQIAEYLNQYFTLDTSPVLADIDLTARYDKTTRQLTLKVAGEVTEDFTQLMGTNVGITVYITEDSITARQYNNGQWVNDYTHNHVLRSVLSAYNGDAITLTANHTYSKEYTTTINTAWNAENVRIVALVNRKGTGLNKDVVNCETLNLKDLTAGVPGDVNGDGQVDIIDVNMVINMMLGKAEVSTAGDVSGDGTVGIEDINAIINIMLGK